MSDDEPEPWTIALKPLPDRVPAEARIRRLLKTAKALRLRAVIVRTPKTLEMIALLHAEDAKETT